MNPAVPDPPSRHANVWLAVPCLASTLGIHRGLRGRFLVNADAETLFSKNCSMFGRESTTGSTMALGDTTANLRSARVGNHERPAPTPSVPTLARSSHPPVSGRSERKGNSFQTRCSGGCLEVSSTNLRASTSGGVDCRPLGRRYGVHRTTIIRELDRSGVPRRRVARKNGGSLSTDRHSGPIGRLVMRSEWRLFTVDDDHLPRRATGHSRPKVRSPSVHFWISGPAEQFARSIAGK